MIAPARYFDLVRDMKHPYDHRLRLVESAKQRGIKATARLFATTVPTVRKWLRRFQQHGPSGLLEHSRARVHQPHKTPPTVEAQLIELRKLLPSFGARRLKREFDLPVGHSAMERIWRVHGLMKKRRRKYQRKQDLAHIKAQWALFQQISADTKDLDDIPHYWPQAQALGLPAIQYTARDVRSGLLFWAFAEKRSASASAVFASRIQQHLHRYGVSLRSGLADRQRQRVQRGFSCRSRGQPACPYSTCRSHFPERRRNRPPSRRRRVLRSGILPKPRRLPGQSPYLPALLQSRPAQLPQGISNSLADHRTPRSSLSPRTLLASSRHPGLPPQPTRGIRCAQASLRKRCEGYATSQRSDESPGSAGISHEPRVIPGCLLTRSIRCPRTQAGCVCRAARG